VTFFFWGKTNALSKQKNKTHQNFSKVLPSGTPQNHHHHKKKMMKNKTTKRRRSSAESLAVKENNSHKRLRLSTSQQLKQSRRDCKRLESRLAQGQRELAQLREVKKLYVQLTRQQQQLSVANPAAMVQQQQQQPPAEQLQQKDSRNMLVMGDVEVVPFLLPNLEEQKQHARTARRLVLRNNQQQKYIHAQELFAACNLPEANQKTASGFFACCIQRVFPPPPLTTTIGDSAAAAVADVTSWYVRTRHMRRKETWLSAKAVEYLINTRWATRLDAKLLDSIRQWVKQTLA